MVVPIMELLHAETHDRHEALEAMPFAVAMRRETLPVGRYVGQLHAYAIVHDALDHTLSSCADPAVRAVWRDDLAKVALLRRDLRSLAALRPDVPPATVAASERFALDIHRTATADPSALLGTLYVMEGSTLGAMVLGKHLRSAFRLDAASGMAYYCSSDRARVRWTHFKTRMNDTVTEQSQQERVVTSARAAYQRIEEILRTLSPD